MPMLTAVPKKINYLMLVNANCDDRCHDSVMSKVPRAVVDLKSECSNKKNFVCLCVHPVHPPPPPPPSFSKLVTFFGSLWDL